MRKHDAKTIVFNLSGATVISVVVLYAVQNFFTAPKVELCSQRYAPGQQFALDDQNGKPLSPIELQARMGMREWGVLQNASIVKSDVADDAKQINVKLETARADTDVDEGEPNGVSFSWPVSSVSNANAVCLSYNVMLSADFEPGQRVRLPGITASGAPIDENNVNADEVRDIALNLGISNQGAIGIEMAGVTSQTAWLGGRRSHKLAAGDWARVEQEVVWNKPGEPNGVLRVWLDGNLVIDNKKIMIRRKPEQAFIGVNADTRYVSRELGKPVTVSLSPFVLQWK